MENILKSIHQELGLEENRNNPQVNNIEKTEPEEYVDSHRAISNSSEDEKILNPFKYLMATQGKNFRQDLIISVNHWLKAPESIFHFVSEILYLTHNFSLMIDDIQDSSVLRRGLPCAHLIYGIPNTVNAVSYLVAHSLNKAAHLNNPTITRIITELLAELTRGQVMDVYWRDNFICPTEEEYNSMVLRRYNCGVLLFAETGSVFYTVRNILQVYSHSTVDVMPLLTALALFFQINDDYSNLDNETFQKSKGFCEDISEGKFSYPVIYVVQNFPEEDILRQRTYDMELLKHCKSIIERCGGLEHAKKVIEKYKSIVVEESMKLGPNPHFNKTFLKFMEAKNHTVVV